MEKRVKLKSTEQVVILLLIFLFYFESLVKHFLTIHVVIPESRVLIIFASNSLFRVHTCTYIFRSLPNVSQLIYHMIYRTESITLIQTDFNPNNKFLHLSAYSFQSAYIYIHRVINRHLQAVEEILLQYS